MTDDPADLRRYADACDAEAANLEARYGSGIRPAWVGEDLTILEHRASRARAEADALDGHAEINQQGEPEPCHR